MVRTYKVSFIHKISNQAGPTLGRDVCLSDASFETRLGLAKALRECGVLGAGQTIATLRKQDVGSGTVVFPANRAFNAWHSITLEPIAKVLPCGTATYSHRDQWPHDACPMCGGSRAVAGNCLTRGCSSANPPRHPWLGQR